MNAFLVLLPVCFACLSKNLRQDTIRPSTPDTTPKQYDRAALHEKKVFDRKCAATAQKISSSYTDTESIKSKLDSVFRKDGDTHGAYMIASNAPFEMKKERNLIWLAATNTGTLESVLTILKGHHKTDQKMFFERGLVNVFGLTVQQVLLWFNQQLYVATEETLSEFICMAGAHYHHFNDRAKRFAELDAMCPIYTGYPPISKFCSTIAQYIYGLLLTFDSMLEFFNSIPSFSHVKINKFEEVYLKLTNEILDATKLEKILSEGCFGDARRVNNQIMDAFEKRYQDTKHAIEEHFNDQVPEDTEQTQIEAVEKSEATIPEVQSTKHIETKEDKEDKEEETVSTCTHPGKSRAEIMAQYNANRQFRLESRFAKERSKHSQRISNLRFDEKDDDDVRFFYTFKNPAANSTFSVNQAQQVCKTSFPSAKRYEHSMFPGISASGTTINFLCSLLVSGTPTYEGFLAAHKDLGGIFVEKRNGNKLFFFKEPISYHKTLHAPHESSRFDHRLYRMFYRNCGLHPYLFKLLE